MRRIILSMAAATTVLVLSLPAQAAGSLIRTFVSAVGLDTNPCTVTAPCRTLAAAYSATAANGIISALDPAGYGSLTITGPITIDGNGWAAITAISGGTGITVNAGPNDKVVLTGLRIDGAGVGQNGIVFNSGLALMVDDCVVRNMMNDGLDFFSNASTTQTLAVSNSHFIGNATIGILIEPQSTGGITAAIDRTEFDSNFDGLVAAGFGTGTGPVTVAVTDSVAANNSNYGFNVSSSTHVSKLSLTRALAVGNGFGVDCADANSTMWLAKSTVVGNTVGYTQAVSAILNSYGDNYIAGNGSNNGVLTGVSQQ